MKYKNVIDEIDNLNATNFTIDSLNTVGIISHTINNMYEAFLLKNTKDAKANYEVVKGHLQDIVFEILKTKLDFDDEVINKILSLMDFFEFVKEIYIVDGNVIFKMKNGIVDEDILCFVPKDAFIDVTSINFVDGIDLPVYKDYFVKAFNVAYDSKLLNNENKKMNYINENNRIYVNKPLKKIMQINTDVTGETAKVIIENNKELNYYDMKMHYGSFELLHNDYQIYKLSEMLGKKSKIKKLK